MVKLGGTVRVVNLFTLMGKTSQELGGTPCGNMANQRSVGILVAYEQASDAFDEWDKVKIVLPDSGCGWSWAEWWVPV
jgi:hypothetical protein